MLARLPASLARRLARAGHVSESGGESLLLFDLLVAGIDVRQQVRLPGVGRVDMIIGERLIIEVDGYEFHSTRADFEEDRRRDAASSALPTGPSASATLRSSAAILPFSPRSGRPWREAITSDRDRARIK